jgi:hypothetical protein
MVLVIVGAALSNVSHAHIVVFSTVMNGANQAIPNGSQGSGTATVTLDLDLVTMRVQTNFSNLTGNVTSANLHGPTATPRVGTAEHATATFPSFPTGTSGSYDRTFDLTLASSYDPAFITASGGTISNALNALISALQQERAYLNVHTSAVPSGEIRGFLTAVPEPSAWMLTALTLVGLAQRRRNQA